MFSLSWIWHKHYHTQLTVKCCMYKSFVSLSIVPSMSDRSHRIFLMFSFLWTVRTSSVVSSYDFKFTQSIHNTSFFMRLVFRWSKWLFACFVWKVASNQDYSVSFDEKLRFPYRFFRAVACPYVLLQHNVNKKRAMCLNSCLNGF